MQKQNNIKADEKELKKLLEGINKKYGDNAINYGIPDYVVETSLERIPTGSFSLDLDLGGGIPVGRFIEVSGEYSSTKTTQAMHIVRNAQKMGFVCLWEDIEGTTDRDYAETLGVDFNKLVYTRPDSMEEGLQMILDLQKSGLVHLGVIDSIASMSPNKEQDSTMADTVQMGITQKLLGEFFRKFQANNNRLIREGNKPFTLIGLNQLREKIGVLYGDTFYSPGGRSKGFFSSVNIRLRRGDWISEGKGDNKEFVGHVVKYKIEKNKTFKRMRSGEFDFYLTHENSAGVKELHNDNLKEVIVCGIEWGVVDRAGSWFMIGSLKYQGIQSLIDALKQDPKLVEEIRQKVILEALPEREVTNE